MVPWSIATGKGIMPLQCFCRMRRQSQRQSEAVRFGAHVELTFKSKFKRTEYAIGWIGLCHTQCRKNTVENRALRSSKTRNKFLCSGSLRQSAATKHKQSVCSGSFQDLQRQFSCMLRQSSRMLRQSCPLSAAISNSSAATLA
jgi:hypothetical protein